MQHVLMRVLGELLLPPFSPFLLLLFAFIVSLRFRRSGIALAACATVLQFGLSLAGLEVYLREPWPAVPERVEPPYPTAQAIVVLGGGRYLDAPEYGGDTAAAGTLERVRYAAKLHRETGLPLLVSGGKPGGVGTRTEAEIMRDILQDEFKVPVRWVEERSEDTRSNARNSAALLLPEQISTVMLVTYGDHMPRAVEEFAAAGLEPVPMPTTFVRKPSLSVFSWTPSVHGMLVLRYWLYEQMARFSPF